MRDLLKRAMAHELGPGGMCCPCCGPAPGKERRAWKRRARRRLAQADRERHLALNPAPAPPKEPSERG